MFRSRKTESDDQPEKPEIGDDMLVIVDRGMDPYLVLFHEPGGFRAEQIRALRNQLMAMNPDGEPKSLVIASAIMGEGKSIVATNLAMAFAELERHKVLLVDARSGPAGRMVSRAEPEGAWRHVRPE